MKGVIVLGSTGSVGMTTLDVLRSFRDTFRVVGLGARRSWQRLAEQAVEFRPDAVALVDPPDGFGKKLPRGTRHLTGAPGISDLAAWPGADIVVNALVGSCGLMPTLRAIEAGRDVCIANKETLVVGGELVSRQAARTGVSLVPMDSEHSAVAQCLRGRPVEEIGRVILTASGGPFLVEPEDLTGVTPRDALSHPVWTMGEKITVDSATMMNKGLEIIEAHWLFGLPQRQIGVLVHPQGVVHGMVEFRDGSTIACLGSPDMRIPVQNALTYPSVCASPLAPCDLASLGSLRFMEPDRGRFPCLKLARQALDAGGTMPAVLSAADEVAVERFLAGEISFTAIADLVGATMAEHRPVRGPSLDDVLAADSWARQIARRFRC